MTTQRRDELMEFVEKHLLLARDGLNALAMSYPDLSPFSQRLNTLKERILDAFAVIDEEETK